MFREYSSDTFEKFNGQHNILVLVGNGFDIAVLDRYKKEGICTKTSSYKDFFEYVQYHELANENNNLYCKMREDRENGKDNWSDFENTICELLNDVSIDSLSDDVDEFQKWFTLFLNYIVDSEVLLKLNSDVQNEQWMNLTLGRFLEDLNDTDLRFKSPFTARATEGHYHLLNYVFLNLNYTLLLDNYIYLDKSVFEPHPHGGSETNFEFYNKLSDGGPGVFQSYILCDILHPHGIQSIPRSMLFGIDLEEYNQGTDKKKALVKGYWAQYDIKYRSYFEGAELFIIYGMSLGKMDAWWFDSIFDAILNKDAELIIYRRKREELSEESVKETFLGSCIRHNDSSDDEKKKVKENIHVVLFENNNTNFLGLKNNKT